MPRVQETIPEELAAEVEAARSFYTRSEGIAFDVTGIVDPEQSLGAHGDEGRELRLVLCGGDRCEQRSFRVSEGGGGYAVSLLDDPAGVDGAGPAPELDPPPGARRGWLDAARQRHAFVLLVFYRGYW